MTTETSLKNRVQSHLNQALALLGSESKKGIVLRIAPAPYDFAFVPYFCKTADDWTHLKDVMGNTVFFETFEIAPNNYVNFSVSHQIKGELLTKWQFERDTYAYCRMKHLKGLLMEEGIKPSQVIGCQEVSLLMSKLVQADDIEAVDQLLETALKHHSFRLLPKEQLSDWLSLMMQLTL